MKQKTKNVVEETAKGKEKNIVVGGCKDPKCPIHGALSVRGRIFKGEVTRKFDKRITIEMKRTVYIRKYERYAKSKTKIHARLPTCLEKEVNIGDQVKIQECRPLSKIIHFVIIEKIKDKKIPVMGKTK